MARLIIPLCSAMLVALLAPSRPANDERLSIASWGTTTTNRHDARTSTTGVRAVRLLSERPLTRDGRARFLAWGPQGHLLLYLDRDVLWLSDVRGQKRWEVVGGPVADAAFTVDGTHILYRPATTAGLLGAIIRINLHGGDRRRLVGPDYRPVGTSATSSGAVGLAASTLQDGRVALQRTGRLFTLDPRHDAATSFGAVQLPALPAANSPPSSWTAVAPHGTRVAIFTTSGALTIQDGQTGRLLRRVVPAGGQRVPGAGLLPTTGVSWSPNDHVLVYKLGGPGGALKAVDLGTGREWTLLRVHLETLSGFTWSPDGRVPAFSDVGAGTNLGPLSEIELINADGSGLRTLDPLARRPGWVQAHVPGQTDPLWSPSGRAIGYTRVSGPTNGARPFQTNVWLADLSAPA